MLSIHRKSWGQQKPPLGSQLLQGHPLGSKVAFSWLINEGGGRPVELITGKHSTLSGSAYGARGMVNAATSNYWDTGVSPLITQGAILWNTFPNFTATDSVRRFFWSSTASGGTVPELSAQKFTDNNLYVGWNVGGADRRVVVSAATAGLTQSEWQQFLFVWGWGGSRLYRNGVLVGSNATAPTTQALSQTIRVNGISTIANVGLPAGGAIDHFTVFQGLITAAEAAWLAVEPYAFMAPPGPRRSYFISGSPTIWGGAATITGTGSLTGAGTRTTFGASAMAGTSTLTSAGTRLAVVSSTLAGTSDLTAAHKVTTFGSAALSGTSTLVATVVGDAPIHYGAAAFTGTGSLASSGTRIAVTSAVLSGLADLTAAGTRIAVSSATLSGISDLAAIPRLILNGAAQLVGNGVLRFTIAGTRVLSAARLSIRLGLGL